MSALRSVDGFLSRRAQAAWPGALVYHQDGANYVIEREGYEPLGLGRNFHEAKQAVEALLKSWTAAEPWGSAERRVREALTKETDDGD